MTADREVLRKSNELFEKYELDSIPKSSWKDLCMIEIKRSIFSIKLDKPKVRIK